MSYKYILRLAIQSGFHESERLASMVDFCQQAQIDDVMFFINCEELNQGHLTREQTMPWLELISRAKQILTPMGITTSVNPWITTLHTDRGRKLQAGQDFTTMVDPYGRVSTAVACPLCPEWESYITDMYALYASIEPHMVWVEDDFRLHNHAPLQWGGCFCPLHMKQFSQRAGLELSREQFVAGLLQPGEPHPYRKIWLDTARESMASLAEKIGQAVHAVSPDTRVGLMSSSPTVHCSEARNWEAILHGLAGDSVPMVLRPHLPAYQGSAGQNYLMGFSDVTQMTQASVPASTELYPELESFPDTRFSKSRAFTRLQLETSLLIGSQGITLNIFDMMGNGAMMTEGYQQTLADVKPLLNSIQALGLTRESRVGVRVLFDPLASYAIHTSQGHGMHELYPYSSFWSSLLSAFGVSNRYDSDLIPEGRVVAISGQYFRGRSREELQRLFDTHLVMLEAEAASILCDLGYGAMAGIKSAKWVAQDSGVVSYEQICDGSVYSGLEEARLSGQTSCGDYLDIEYLNTPMVLSQMKSPAGETAGVGCAVVEGRVFVLPYGHFGMQNHLNPVRQAMIQEVLHRAELSERPAYVQDAPYVYLQQHVQHGKQYLLLSNFSDDDVSMLRLFLPGEGSSKAHRISRDGESAISLVSDGEFVTIPGTLHRWETQAIVIG